MEDDGVISMLLTMMLEEMGFEVCGTASSEVEAVVEAARTRPDLIVTDVNLAEGNGIAAIEAICRKRPTPHIFISAAPSVVRSLHPDAIVLEKPFHFADLERAIGKATQLPPQPDGATRLAATR